MEGVVVAVPRALHLQEEEGEEEQQLGHQVQEVEEEVVEECQLGEWEKKLLQLQGEKRLRVEGEGEER
jgi:hypothetical protein